LADAVFDLVWQEAGFMRRSSDGVAGDIRSKFISQEKIGYLRKSLGNPLQKRLAMVLI
jgi:hypothetical protein